MPNSKTCTTCLVFKLLEEFPKGNSRYERHSMCRKCHADRSLEYRTLHPQKAAASKRKSWLKKLYKMTPENYDQMYSKQEGVCAICLKPPQNVAKAAHNKLNIDHNHTTGEVRGLLCNRCNRAIGLFEDNSNLLAAATKYLCSIAA
jgi:hypothetical protein